MTRLLTNYGFKAVALRYHQRSASGVSDCTSALAPGGFAHPCSVTGSLTGSETS
jgi:hypothetical protein